MSVKYSSASLETVSTDTPHPGDIWGYHRSCRRPLDMHTLRDVSGTTLEPPWLILERGVHPDLLIVGVLTPDPCRRASSFSTLTV